MKQIKVLGNLVLGLLLMIVWPGLYMKAGNSIVMLYWQAHLAFFTMAVIGLGFILYSFYQIYIYFIKPKFSKA